MGEKDNLIVLLHGWGANAEDLIDLQPYLDLPNCEFMFPEGLFPHPYTMTGKMWYSFDGVGVFNGESYRQLGISKQFLEEYLQGLPDRTGIPLERTYLGGFSQGGAMTLEVGLNLPLGGLIVLSGYLHPHIVKPAIAHRMPILIVHGINDEVVPLHQSIHSRDQLTSWGYGVTYRQFDMGHLIIPEALTAIRDFVNPGLDG